MMHFVHSEDSLLCKGELGSGMEMNLFTTTDIMTIFDWLSRLNLFLYFCAHQQQAVGEEKSPTRNPVTRNSEGV